AERPHRPGRWRPGAPAGVAPVVSDDPLHQLVWLSARSAGLVAWALAGLATLLGLAMAARLVDRGPQVRDLHRHLTLATLIAVAGHGLAIALDSFLKAGLVGIFVPLDRKEHTSELQSQ